MHPPVNDAFLEALQASCTALGRPADELPTRAFALVPRKRRGFVVELVAIYPGERTEPLKKRVAHAARDIPQAIKALLPSVGAGELCFLLEDVPPAESAPGCHWWWTLANPRKGTPKRVKRRLIHSSKFAFIVTA